MASVTNKILMEHLKEGGLEAGKEIMISIDQTLTQDATGTMAFLEFEALGIPKVKTGLSVSYVDHNMLQSDFRNADDHAYLKSVAAKYGVLFSRPGNGICHQVHLERFAAPGKTLLGSDSHTPTAGGVGSLAIGAGGLDVALAMGGGPFTLNAPKIVGVRLTGKLQEWVGAKDVILELLKMLTVKGGVGKVFEYFGPGVETLSVPERATITNMGAELGATSSIFPSDARTREYLKAQGRESTWKELKCDSDSDFSEIIELDLSKVEPNAAQPHSPDSVCKIAELEGKEVQQVIVGSCTNSSYRDLMAVAGVLKGKKVHPGVSLAILPGSRQVYETIARNGALADMVAAGARILESACGPCIGMGQAPGSGNVTVRTFNRNFKGRCGTQDANAYLVSPETAAAIALNGKFTDPRKLGAYPNVPAAKLAVDDSMIIRPPEDGSTVEIMRGPNIAPLPELRAVDGEIEKEVLLKTGDNVTTDHILPAGAKILPLRSNIPAISEFVFTNVDAEFAKRAKEKQGGFIIGGENYGQGSSREHAAIGPLYLGVKAVIAKNFARIHKANLVNWGIVPLEFENPEDYDKVDQGDMLSLRGLREGVRCGKVAVANKTKGTEFAALCQMGEKSKNVLLAGGSIMHAKGDCPMEKIEMKGGKLAVPDNPVIPYIEGDGVGADISPVMRKVVDAAVEKAYKGKRKISWKKILAGEEAMKGKGEYLPQETVDAIKVGLVAIKGPLTTQVGGGFRSLNVTLRQVLDLYCCVRPSCWFEGTPAPVKEPQKMNVVIFRENTEDVYAGIEWKEGTPEAKKVRSDSAIGVKPMSVHGCKRLVRAAINYALANGHKSVTLVHKGNIMKFTEGGFCEWGYEVAKQEFGNKTITEKEMADAGITAAPEGKILVNDRIADAMFQQLLLRPEEYSVLATPNLNGDYISDACAAQVGGLGMAPGANINYVTGHALFEATHGTAPKHAGQDKANPGSLILSAAMMLDYIGWQEAARLVEKGLEAAIRSKKVTYDLERQIEGATLLKCSEFGEEIVRRM